MYDNVLKREKMMRPAIMEEVEALRGINSVKIKARFTARQKSTLEKKTTLLTQKRC
jgi:hypothetical protein